MNDRKQKLIEVFNDTQRFCRQNPQLAYAVQEAKLATKLYEPDDPVDEPMFLHDSTITVTMHKSFEAAILIHKAHPNWKIGVLNFASATNPGGGVKNGSSAQEESLCRCSTLYPALAQDWLWTAFYGKNRAAKDPLHTDACIYTPGVVICKTDETYPQRMDEADWVTVDVISCAAPNLRKRPGNIHNPEGGFAVDISPRELYKLHRDRAERIMHIAGANDVDALILGAFGCGAFQNDPAVVATAMNDALDMYRRNFLLVEFAVYCGPYDTGNYDAFKERILETAP